MEEFIGGVIGWGDMEYLVIIQEEEVLGHLGQGCISTPGHSRRKESIVRERPMFPPHLGGPRISTELGGRGQFSGGRFSNWYVMYNSVLILKLFSVNIFSIFSLSLCLFKADSSAHKINYCV